MRVKFQPTELGRHSKSDLIQLEVNPGWTKLFADARAKLRREVLRGRSMNKDQTEQQGCGEEEEEEEEDHFTGHKSNLAPPRGRDSYKNSWRRNIGSKSRYVKV